MWLGQSTLELNRDGVYAIIRNIHVPMREELTEDEVRNYCNSQVMEHLHKKGARDIGGFQHKDALFAAASSHKVDYSKNLRPEKGIKITVGAPKPSSSS